MRLLKQRLEGTATRGERVIGRAVQALSVLTQELGVALAPSFEDARLERLNLIPVASDRLLLVLTMSSAQAKTIFVDVPREVSGEQLQDVTAFLNDRLAGLTVSAIRENFTRRMADPAAGHEDILNIFVQSAERFFAADPQADQVVLGTTSGLAAQPEFSSDTGLRSLLTLTEEKTRLAQALASREPGLKITIGVENLPALSDFSLITADYHLGQLRGTIGIMGPTRMPYEKIVSLVQYTSRLISDVFEQEEEV
jgi:heat-inducible transcriptional repressor